MSFIASPPNPASPAGAKISCGTFWGDIDLNKCRDTVRIGASTVTDPRLIAALQGAVLTVITDLAEWKATQIEAGYATLAAIPSDTIDNTSIKVILFQRAVLAYAAADLIETHRDITATNEAIARAETIMPTAAEHRRNGLHAIRDLKGVPRTKVSLI